MSKCLVEITVTFHKKGDKLDVSTIDEACELSQLWHKTMDDTVDQSSDTGPLVFKEDNAGFWFRFIGESCVAHTSCGMEREAEDMGLDHLFDADMLDEFLTIAKELREKIQTDHDETVNCVRYITLWDYSVSFSESLDSFGEWSSDWSFEGVISLKQISELLAKPSA